MLIDIRIIGHTILEKLELLFQNSIPSLESRTDGWLENIVQKRVLDEQNFLAWHICFPWPSIADGAAHVARNWNSRHLSPRATQSTVFYTVWRVNYFNFRRRWYLLSCHCRRLLASGGGHENVICSRHMRERAMSILANDHTLFCGSHEYNNIIYYSHSPRPIDRTPRYAAAAQQTSRDTNSHVVVSRRDMLPQNTRHPTGTMIAYL